MLLKEQISSSQKKSSLFYSPDSIFLYAFTHVVASRLLFSNPHSCSPAPVKMTLVFLLRFLSQNFGFLRQSRSHSLGLVLHSDFVLVGYKEISPHACMNVNISHPRFWKILGLFQFMTNHFLSVIKQKTAVNLSVCQLNIKTPYLFGGILSRQGEGSHLLHRSQMRDEEINVPCVL